MTFNELVTSVRKIVNKPKGFKVFFASGLNINDVRTTILLQMSQEERALVVQLFNESFSECVKDLKEPAQFDEYDEKLVAMFNALYETTSNLSHVANVYTGSNEVVAIMHDRPIEEGDIKIVSATNDSTNVSVQLPEFVSHDVNVISFQSLVGKNRKHIYGNIGCDTYSPVELLTILTNLGDGKQIKVLVRNFPVMANYSYILSAEGKLVRQRYGEHWKFIDVHGKNHYSGAI